MNLSALDLNLLVALDALIDEAHVGRAAARIGLSQPAASHALRRLREIMGDPLLVRVGGHMELTPRALALQAPLEQALTQLRGLFQPAGFDPASSQRRFKLMLPDLVVELIMPQLVQAVAKAAPGVQLQVTSWRGPEIMTPEFARTIDLVIAFTAEAFPGFHRQLLYRDKDVLAVRRGHPLGARLSRLEVFLKARHVAVIAAGERKDPIDHWLRKRGIERQASLTVPSYFQAVHMAAATDLVAFVPGRLTAALAPALGLMVVPPPVDPGLDEQYLFHPTRAQQDGGSIWLRQLVLQIGRGLEKAKRGK